MVDSHQDEAGATGEESPRPLTAAERRARAEATPEPIRPASVAARRTPVKRVPKQTPDVEVVQADPVKAPRKRVARPLPTPPDVLAVQEPVVQEAVVEEPVVQTPVVEESVVQEPVVTLAPVTPRPAPRPAPVIQEPVPGVPITKTHVAGVVALLVLLLRRRRRRRR